MWSSGSAAEKNHMSGRRRAKQRKDLNQLSFSFLAILTGIIAGFGAVSFRWVIAFFHNLLFYGKLSLHYDSNIHAPQSPWGLLIILVPVVGALGVTFLIKLFGREVKGSGVPEVMNSIYYRKGIIRPLIAPLKALTSALSIGSGASVGREGPIIQIGASLASALGQIFRMPVWQRVTLIAAGAGAGIAATFNTPIGGVLFAVEIMLAEVSVRTLVPVALSTGTATYIGRLFLGEKPAFIIPKLSSEAFHLTEPAILFSFIGLGILLGFISSLFIKSIYGFEDFFTQKFKKHVYLSHATGMLLLGIIMYVLMRTTGHYFIQGVGYAAIQDVLTNSLTVGWILLLLFFLKLIAVSLSLGSGSSGGIFSPGLFLGATLGGAYGIFLKQIFPAAGFSPPAFAVAGMAGIIGGSTGAALTSIVMIFEMTFDYTVIVPMTITVAISYGISRLLTGDTIYTMKITRRGRHVPEALQTNFHHLTPVKHILEKNFGIISAEVTLARFAEIVALQPDEKCFLVIKNGQIIGLVSRDISVERVRKKELSQSVMEFVNRNFILVKEDKTLFDTVVKMRLNKASFAVVTSNGKMERTSDIRGLITQKHVAQALERSVELFSE